MSTNIGQGNFSSKHHRDSAVSSDGTWWVLIGIGDARFFWSTDQGETWTQDTSATIGSLETSNIHSLFIDADDNIYAAYCDDGNTDVILRRAALGTVDGVPRIGGATGWSESDNFQIAAGDNSTISDVVAFPFEGETYAAVVYRTSGVNLICRIYQWTGFSWNQVHTTTLDTASAPMAQIDFHHTGDGKTVQDGQPDIFVTWCTGGTGDILWRRLDWDTGTTWNTGTTRTINDGTSQFNVSMVFDGTRCIIAGWESDRILVFERDAADTTTTDRTPTSLFGKTFSNQYNNVYYTYGTKDIILVATQIVDEHPIVAVYDRANDSWPNEYGQIHHFDDAREGVQILRNEGGVVGDIITAIWNNDSSIQSWSTSLFRPSAPFVESGGWGAVSLGGVPTIPQLKSFQQTRNAATSTSLVLTKPAGIVDGDFLMLLVTCDSTLSQVWEDQPGWVKNLTFHPVNAGGGIGFAVYTRVADGTESATETITMATTQEAVGWYSHWSPSGGVSNGQQYETPDSTGDTLILGGITTVVDHSVAVLLYVIDGSDGHPGRIVDAPGWDTTENGYPPRGRSNYSPLPSDLGGVSSGWSDKELPIAGGSGPATIDSSTNDWLGGMMFSLKSPTVLPAPQMEGFTITEQGTAQDTIVMTKPSDVVVGDLLIIMVANDYSTDFNSQWEALTGWNQAYARAHTTADVDRAMYWRIATGGEGATETLDMLSSRISGGWYTRWKNAGGIDVIGDESVSSGADLVMNSVISTEDYTTAVAFWASDGSDTRPYSVIGSSWDVRYHDQDIESPASAASGVAAGWTTKDMPLAGATGGPTIEKSSSDGHGGEIFVVKR